ncbi:MAG: Dabb family protein [Cyclobacteriaceae bacterium]
MKGPFVHTVFFWLKEPDNQDHRALFLSELKMFIDGIDLILNQHVGAPAGTPRDVVDNSYTFSLIVSFESKEDHDTYQEHPLHKQFIANASMLWSRVQVYDSIRQ